MDFQRSLLLLVVTICNYGQNWSGFDYFWTVLSDFDHFSASSGKFWLIMTIFLPIIASFGHFCVGFVSFCPILAILF